MPTDDAKLLDESSTDEATPAPPIGEVDDNKEEERLESPWIDIAVDSLDSVVIGLGGIGIGIEALAAGLVIWLVVSLIVSCSVGSVWVWFEFTVVELRPAIYSVY